MIKKKKAVMESLEMLNGEKGPFVDNSIHVSRTIVMKNVFS